MSERATIFAMRPSGTLCFFPYFHGEPEDLSERIRFVSEFDGVGFIPVGWTVERFSYANYDEAHAESIAAGRLIEQVDGQWIARGVEEKKDEKAVFVEQKLDALSDLLMPVGPEEIDPLFAAAHYGHDLHPADARMIARDTKFSTPVHISETGKVSVKPSDVIAHPKFQSDLQVVKKLREAHPPIAGLSVSTESGRSHLVSPVFGSADFVR
jgi:hypothetical protein